MSDPKPTPPKTLQQVADEMRDAAIEYYRTNTEADEARREAEEEVRVRALLERLEREGKLPPRDKKKGE